MRNNPDFWSNVIKGDGCWEWQGNTNARYGMFRGRGAHRIALEEAIGRTMTPDEMACHHCDNPPCVRPDHLYVGDYRTNAKDYAARGKGRRA